ncbi:MAG: DUF2116 family Zn-ribbon domain-containing protein [Candidatus Methanoplasma sp.]|jgi:predicted nucleic acid-binding Zn ribbon protein|nr:DUF2116 family Zn-ribbon domain-containing protein [Candidatus Methanoplasma sp.]
MTALPEHDHCRFCGDAVPFDMRYCSMECYRGDEARMKRERRNGILFAAAAIASVAAIAAAGILLS